MSPLTLEVGPVGDRPDPAALALVLRRVAEGEQASLAELYDHTIGHVHRLALTMTGGDADRVAAVVRSTYQEVWCTARSWDGASGALAWVLAATRGAGLATPPEVR